MERFFTLSGRAIATLWTVPGGHTSHAPSGWEPSSHENHNPLHERIGSLRRHPPGQARCTVLEQKEL